MAIFKQFCRTRTRRTPERNVLVSSVSAARSWDASMIADAPDVSKAFGGFAEFVDVRLRDTDASALETSESAVLRMNETEARDMIRKLQTALETLEIMRKG